MTDAPFAETHRETLLALRPQAFAQAQDAIDAALKEIDRLTKIEAAWKKTWWYYTYGRATALVQACANTECVPLAELNAAKAEIDRLTKENADMRKHLDGLFGIAHPEDGGA